MADRDEPPKKGSEVRFLFLLRDIGEPGAAEYSELVSLVAGNATLLAIARTLADEALARAAKPPFDRDEHAHDAEHSIDEKPAGDDLLSRARVVGSSGASGWAAFLQALNGEPDLAVEYIERLFQIPLPVWPSNFEDCRIAAETHLERVLGTWARLSETARIRLAPAYAEAVGALRASAGEHPVVRLYLMEKQAELDRSLAASLARPAENSAEDERTENTVEEEVDDLLGLDDLPEGAKRLVRSAPDAYLQAIIDCLERLHASPLAASGDESFLLDRLLPMGPKANRACGIVLKRLRALCADDRDHTQEAAKFGMVLWKLGLEDVPKEIHDAHEQNEVVVEDFYAQWAKAAPRKRLEEFLAAYRMKPAVLDDHKSWESGLHDSQIGITLFAKALGQQPEASDIWRRLAVASKNAGDVVTRFVFHMASEANEAHDLPRVLRLLEPLPSRDEKHATLLRLARIAEALVAFEAGNGEFAAMLANAKDLYPEDPMVLYIETLSLLRQRGPVAGAAQAVHAMRTLSFGDLVYRKAIFQYARNEKQDWTAFDPGNVYGLFRMMQGYFSERACVAGAFNGQSEALDRDPFYDGLYSRISALPAPELDAALAAYRAEASFAAKANELSEDELVTYLDRKNWQISYLIVQRLATKPEGPRVAAILKVYDWFREDEPKRLALASLLWPLAPHRAQILGSIAFQRDLSWFFGAYRGVTAIDLAKEAFRTLLAMNRADVVIATARNLDETVAIGCFISILTAFNSRRDFEGAIGLIEKILKTMSAERPDFVLMTSNLAVEQMQAGRRDDAEKTLARLFAMDWRRFDHTPSPLDRELAKIVGGDLDAEYAKIFRIYMASARYNAACLYALTARPENALGSLLEAKRLHATGYPREKIAGEADFASLHSRSDFQEFLRALTPQKAVAS